MNITGIKSAKYGSSFHKSPLLLAKDKQIFPEHFFIESYPNTCVLTLHPGVMMATWGCPVTKVLYR